MLDQAQIAAAQLVGSEDPGTIAFGAMSLDAPGTAQWLILIAFGVKACFPGFHVWLVDGYPAATPTGTSWTS